MRSEPPGPADEALLGAYAAWPEKGPDTAGVRLSIRADPAEVDAGAEVRVVHVVEAFDSRELYVMGPKDVTGEYVDGQPSTPSADVDPLVPLDYDGRVISGPGVDANYLVTVYAFDRAGIHSIVWQPSPYASNELRIVVR